MNEGVVCDSRKWKGDEHNTVCYLLPHHVYNVLNKILRVKYIITKSITHFTE